MKKILVALLAGAISLSLFACGNSEENSSTPTVDAPSVTDEGSVANDAPVIPNPAEEPADVQAPVAEGAAVFPEIDGLTKMEQAGVTVYQTEDGSTIAVTALPAAEADIEGFNNKTPEYKAQMDQQLAQANGAVEGVEMNGDFLTIGGQDAYCLTMETQGMAIKSYVILKGTTFYSMAGVSPTGADLTGEIETIIQAL